MLQKPPGNSLSGLAGDHCRKDMVAADWRETIAARIRSQRIGGRPSPRGYGRGGLAFWTCRTGRTSQTSRIHKKARNSQIFPKSFPTFAASRTKRSINITQKTKRMKTKAMIGVALLCATFVFTSCDNDDDRYVPESAVLQAFSAKYPTPSAPSGRASTATRRPSSTSAARNWKPGSTHKATGC